MDLAETEIAATDDPYARALLYLTMLDWEIQKNRDKQARTTIAHMNKVSSPIPDQQVLILGARSQALLPKLVTPTRSQTAAQLALAYVRLDDFSVAMSLASGIDDAAIRDKIIRTANQAQQKDQQT